MLTDCTVLMTPHSRYPSTPKPDPLRYPRKINKPRNFMRLAMEYLSQLSNSEPLNPFKHKMLKYFSFYVKWILSNSRFLGGVYIAGTSSLVQRRYSASRNSIYNRYKHVFPRRFYKQVHLSEAIYVAFQHKNLNYLISFLKEMFTVVNFFKHRFLLYYLRAAFSRLGGKQGVPGIRGLFIKFRGKLAKAGNSRRQRFLLAYGQVTTNYSDTYVVEKFQIKTFTGAIGCTIIMCCS